MCESVCKKCGAKPKNEIAKKDIYVKGYCFSCCMELGGKAEKEFTNIIMQKCPELMDAFTDYSFKRGLRDSAAMLD